MHWNARVDPDPQLGLRPSPRINEGLPPHSNAVAETCHFTRAQGLLGISNPLEQVPVARIHSIHVGQLLAATGRYKLLPSLE